LHSGDIAFINRLPRDERGSPTKGSSFYGGVVKTGIRPGTIGKRRVPTRRFVSETFASSRQRSIRFSGLCPDRGKGRFVSGDGSGADRLANLKGNAMTRTRLRRFFRHGFFPQLVAFEACVRHGSVTRAAEELSLAQPTVSCLVRKLADAVGGPVLEAQGRRMEPTALGREVVALCEEMFDSIDRFDGRREALLANGGPVQRPAAPVEVSSGA
jgi:hypothetical protein